MFVTLRALIITILVKNKKHALKIVMIILLQIFKINCVYKRVLKICGSTKIRFVDIILSDHKIYLN